MADPNVSLAPATPIDIPLERSLYIGNFFRGILLGVEIFTFFTAVYTISHRPSHYRKRQRFYIIYGGILLALVTIQVASNGLWGQFMWIDHRNHPGGPLGFYVSSQVAWYVITGVVSTAMANIVGDGLLVYRCFIIWDSRWRIIALPALIYLASIVLAIITVVEAALPGAVQLAGKPALLAMPWFSMSVGLNVIVTTMICVRILRIRALVRDVISPEMSSMYTSIATMLIESAVPFSVLGIGLVITVALDVGPKFAFAYVWSIFCSLSPQMIILRVSMGRAWLKETANELTSAVEFAEPVTTHEQSRKEFTMPYNIQLPTADPGTLSDGSDTAIRKHIIATVVPPV